jgi:biopolymer transport protein ExbD
MQIQPPRAPRSPRESVVPMINIVFLLLIFFLMTAQIAPREPFDVALPEADAETAPDGAPTLFIAADGSLAFGEARDAEVWDTLAAIARSTDKPGLLIRADANLPAAELAALLPRLAALGLGQVRLITVAG